MVRTSTLPRLKHSLKLALIFQVAWIVAAIVALAMGLPVKVGLLAGLLFMPFIPAAFEFITRIKLPDALQLHYHAFITASSVAGSAFGVYALVGHWDTLVHIDSGVLLAWLGFFAVRRAQEQGMKGIIPRWFTLSVAIAVSLAFAALWEISEFLSDTFLGSSTQANLEDSIVDMAAGAIGALIAVAIAVWLRWPKSVLPKSSYFD